MTKEELFAGKITPPERIYDWQNNQMSIARYYGWLNYMGHSYTIAENEKCSPLVRADVLQREVKANKKAAKIKRAAETQAAQAAHGSLI
jgi:hypothetical protein